MLPRALQIVAASAASCAVVAVLAAGGCGPASRPTLRAAAEASVGSRVASRIAAALEPALESVAHAKGSDDVDREIARRHFTEGTAYYLKGDYAKALLAFQAARKIDPLPAFDYNIGRCLDRLERPAEAIVAYQRYVDEQPKAPDAADVRSRIGVLRARALPDLPFAAAVDYPTGSKPHGLLAADLNHDDRTDLVVLEREARTLAVYLAGKGGAFPPRPAAYPLRFFPSAVVAADFDGDGLTDLAVADGLRTRIAVLRGTTSGAFQPENIYYDAGMSSSGVTALAVADVNHDSLPDLVAVGKGGLVVLQSRPGGTFFRRQGLDVGQRPVDVVAADLNGDGRPDAAVLAGDARELYVYLTDKRGRLRPAGAYPSGNDPRALLAADLDGDHRPELLVALGAPRSVRVFPGIGAGRFGKPGTFPGGTFPVALAAGDFDRDGNLDVATVSSDGRQLHLLRGDGSRGFGQPLALKVGERPIAVACGDFNGDGKPDLAVLLETGQRLAVLLNRR